MVRATQNFAEQYPSRFLLLVQEFRDSMNDFLLSGSHRTSSGVTCVVDSASRREGNLMNRSRMINGMLQRLTMEVEIRQNRFITEPVITWATDIAFAGVNQIGLGNLVRRVDDEELNSEYVLQNATFANMRRKPITENLLSNIQEQITLGMSSFWDTFAANPVQNSLTVLGGAAMANALISGAFSTTTGGNQGIINNFTRLVTGAAQAAVGINNAGAAVAGPLGGAAAVATAGIAAAGATAYGIETGVRAFRLSNREGWIKAKAIQRKLFTGELLSSMRDMVVHRELFSQQNLNLVLNPNLYGAAGASILLNSMTMQMDQRSSFAKAYRLLRMTVRKTLSIVYVMLSTINYNRLTEENQAFATQADSNVRSFLTSADVDICTDLSSSSAFIFHDLLDKWSFNSDCSGTAMSTVHGMRNCGSWFEVSVEDASIQCYQVADEDNVKMCRGDASYDMYSHQSLPRYARERQWQVWQRIQDKFNSHIAKAPFQQSANNKLFRRDVLHINEFGKYSLDTSDLTVVFEDHVSQKTKRISNLQMTNLMSCQGSENGVFARALEIACNEFGTDSVISKLLVEQVECNGLGIERRYLSVNPFRKYESVTQMRKFQSMKPPRITTGPSSRASMSNSYNLMHTAQDNTLNYLQTLGSLPEWSSFHREFFCTSMVDSFPDCRSFDHRAQILYRKLKLASLSTDQYFPTAVKRKIKHHWAIYQRLCELCGGPAILRPAPFTLLIDYDIASRLKNGQSSCTQAATLMPIKPTRQWDSARGRAVPDYTGRQGHYLPEANDPNSSYNIDKTLRDRAIVDAKVA